MSEIIAKMDRTKNVSIRSGECDVASDDCADSASDDRTDCMSIDTGGNGNASLEYMAILEQCRLPPWIPSVRMGKMTIRIGSWKPMLSSAGRLKSCLKRSAHG